MSYTASLRISEKCRWCETSLIVPESSECVDDRTTVHVWHCPICGNNFKTVDAVVKTMSDDKHVDDCLTGLLVA